MAQSLAALKSATKSDLFICRACIDEVSRKLGKPGLVSNAEIGCVGDADLQRIVSSCEDAAECAARFGDTPDEALRNAALKIGLMELVESQMAAVERHVLRSVDSRSAAAPVEAAASGDAPQMVSRVPTFLRLVRTTVTIKAQLERAREDLASLKRLPAAPVAMTPTGSGKLRPLGWSENAQTPRAAETIAELRQIVATPKGSAALIEALAGPEFESVVLGCSSSAVSAVKDALAARSREQARALNGEIARLRAEITQSKAARAEHAASLEALRRDAEGGKSASVALESQLAHATAEVEKHAAAAATADERARAAVEAELAATAKSALGQLSALRAELEDARADANLWSAHVAERGKEAAAVASTETANGLALAALAAERDAQANQCSALRSEVGFCFFSSFIIPLHFVRISANDWARPP